MFCLEVLKLVRKPDLQGCPLGTKVCVLCLFESNVLLMYTPSDHVALRIRDITGKILRTLSTFPEGSLVDVPSLGAIADKYVDAATYLPAVIRRINIAATRAYKRSNAHAYFVEDLTTRGMSEVEADFIWEIVDIQVVRRGTYRKRMPLAIE